MNSALERLVWQRARSRCEYCRLPQAFSPLPHAVDHIISQQQHGPTVEENLALACFFCNSYKGPNIAALNPQSGRSCACSTPERIAGIAISCGMAPTWSGAPTPAASRSPCLRSTAPRPWNSASI